MKPRIPARYVSNDLLHVFNSIAHDSLFQAPPAIVQHASQEFQEQGHPSLTVKFVADLDTDPITDLPALAPSKKPRRKYKRTKGRGRKNNNSAKQPNLQLRRIEDESEPVNGEVPIPRSGESTATSSSLPEVRSRGATAEEEELLELPNQDIRAIGGIVLYEEGPDAGVIESVNGLRSFPLEKF